jgi:hypothetical protein
VSKELDMRPGAVAWRIVERCLKRGTIASGPAARKLADAIAREMRYHGAREFSRGWSSARRGM